MNLDAAKIKELEAIAERALRGEGIVRTYMFEEIRKTLAVRFGLDVNAPDIDEQIQAKMDDRDDAERKG